MNRIMSFGAALALVLAGAAGRAEATEYMFTTIDYPGAAHTYAMGINDSGKIIGMYMDKEDVYHSFILDGGGYTSFDPPSAIQTGSQAYDINNLGQIVGLYDAGWRLRGFLRTGDDYQDVVYPGDPGTLVTGINDLGQAVGYLYPSGFKTHGFLFDGASYTTINDMNAVGTYARGINNAGVVVGAGWGASGPDHGFVRDVDGTYTDFQLSGWPTEAGGINDLGQIVGRYGPTPDDHYGFVLSGGVGSTPDTLRFPAATFTEAWGINNQGRVVGQYSTGTFTDGSWRSFLATPIAAADFDQDGDVDGADLVLWQGDYGLNANCDADGDGDTDGRDFLVWQRQYIAGVPGLAKELAIPEPASLCLMLMALAGGVFAARNTF